MALRLWVIFADDPGAPIFRAHEIGEERRGGRSVDEAFEEAASRRSIEGRPVHRMWTADPDSEQGNVAIKSFGGVPPIPTTPETKWY